MSKTTTPSRNQQKQPDHLVETCEAGHTLRWEQDPNRPFELLVRGERDTQELVGLDKLVSGAYKKAMERLKDPS